MTKEKKADQRRTSPFSIALKRYNLTRTTLYPTHAEFEQQVKKLGVRQGDRIELYQALAPIKGKILYGWRGIYKTGQRNERTCTWMTTKELLAFLPFVNGQIKKAARAGVKVEEIWLSESETNEADLIVAVNPVHVFVSERVRFRKDLRIKFIDLFEAYQAFLKEKGKSGILGRNLFSNEFMRVARGAGHEVKRKHIGSNIYQYRGYHGCDLKP